MIIEIVILGMIALFLGLRLYSVLGRRPDHADEGPRTRSEPADATLNRAPAGELVPQGRPTVIAAPARALTSPAELGIKAIAAADRRFDAALFVEGAKAAYGMILAAFWRGDKEELAHLCDRDVYEDFAAAIDARNAASETVENRLVRIEEAVISAADYAAPLARITVRFTADIAALTRDKDGHIIAGSLDDAVESRDLWTFSRNVTSATPDWVLDETDDA